MMKHFCRWDQKKAANKIVYRIECKTMLASLGEEKKIKQRKGKVPKIVFCNIIKYLFRPISLPMYHLPKYSTSLFFQFLILKIPQIDKHGSIAVFKCACI